jgi:hypothetical protein
MPCTITYDVIWTPPQGWPAGTVNIEAAIMADQDKTFMVEKGFSISTATMIAETSISETLTSDPNGIAAIQLNLDRIKDAGDGTLTKNITSISAKYLLPADGIEITGVLGIGGNAVWDEESGNFTVVFDTAIQPDNTPVAYILVRNDASALETRSVGVACLSIEDDQGQNIPEETQNSISFMRGNTDGSIEVDIGDASWIAQFRVGKRNLDQIRPVNAASVSHDTGGDVVDIGDASWVAQYRVGKLNEYYK